MNLASLKLPQKFLLGAATAAHQIEGYNVHSDWWQAEILGKVPKSGRNADHYSLYDADFAMARQIGLGAMRISIEWSRIEPEEGVWNMDAVAHYADVLESLRRHGLASMVTLSHFTLPQWLASRGGFANRDVVKYFERFTLFVAQRYGSLTDFWITVNEPEVLAIAGYVHGNFPPFQKNKYLTAWKVEQNIIAMHRAAYAAVKSVLPHAQVGIAKNVTYYEPYRPWHPIDRAIVGASRYFGNDYFVSRVARSCDFIGLNYYFYNNVAFSFSSGFKLMNQRVRHSDMYEKTYPKGLYFLLKNFARYGKPLFITENGTANAAEPMRQRFIFEHLEWTRQAITEGVDVRGYFYWSLLDTYEWHDGYNLKFGLIEVNYHTLERTVRAGAEIFKVIR